MHMKNNKIKISLFALSKHYSLFQIQIFIKFLVINSKNNTIYFIKPNLKQFFLSKINNFSSKNIEAYDLDHNFELEIESFSKKLVLNNQQLTKFWKKIRRSISAYFIKQSYIKSNFNRIKKYKEILESKPTEFSIKENEYIFLRHSGDSNSSHIELMYHIEKEELFVSKLIFDAEEPKLFQRELDNYLDCHHPFLSRYFGTVEIGQKKYLAIEYINGNTLNHINEMNLDFYDRVKITFEIMIGIQYIHEKDYIYRDLKPNNLMIDQNKNCIIIDFDRMVKNSAENTGSDSTKSFNIDFGTPELFDDFEYSKEVDIFSLGKIIHFIFFQNKNKIDEITKFKLYQEDYMVIQDICNECIQDNPKMRSKLSKLLIDLFNYIYLRYFISLQFDGEFLEYWSIIGEYSYKGALNVIGIHYLETKKGPTDYEKGIYFLKLAADNNDSVAQLNLGNYYINGEKVNYNINAAIKYYTQAANNNNIVSIYKLWIIYYTGRYIEKNNEKAIYYLTKAANFNHKDAQFFLGIFYFEGILLPRDINKSIFYLTLSADQGHSNAQYSLGVLLLTSDLSQFDENKAIKYLRLAANQNNQMAKEYLKIIYKNGIRSQKNIEKSIEYYYLSANVTESETYLKIGYMFYTGKILPKNIEKAVEYLLKAANENNITAYNFIGLIYIEGKYVRKNVNKALKYFSYASDNNSGLSQYYLGQIYYKGNGVSKDYKKAFDYFNQSLKNGHIPSELYISKMYLKGRYVQKDIKKALYYINDAVNKGDPSAMNYLGCMYYQGTHFPKEINQGLYYIKLAADRGYTMAQYNIGFYYFQVRNIQEAIKYFKIAADKNYYGAHYLLGYIYYNGICVPKDIKKAYNYFVLAGKHNMPEAFYYLGLYNLKGDYIQKNIKKGLNYLIISAHQNLDCSQNYLGSLYYFGKIVPRNIHLAIEYLSLSAANYNNNSLYLLGFIYHQGSFIKRNIDYAIRYYKEASSFNNYHAKINLAIIYKNGFDCEINIPYSIELLEEAIKLDNDPIAMYDLAHILFFNENIKTDIDRSIFLLKNSLVIGFKEAEIFLCLVLVSKFKSFDNYKIIKDEIDDGIEQADNLAFNLFHLIKINYLEDQYEYKIFYDQIKENDFVYDYIYDNDVYLSLPNLTKDFMNNENNQVQSIDNRKNINEEFYLGFDIS